MADAIPVDGSSGTIQYTAPGSTWRGIGSSWFNSNAVAKEDFTRNEVAKDNDLIRQMQYLQAEQQFNSAEAEKNRSWQTEMSNTAYQRAVKDMQLAGINPILAYSNGGSSTPSGSSASSSGSYQSEGYHHSKQKDGLSDLLNIVLSVAQVLAGSLSGGSSGK